MSIFALKIHMQPFFYMQPFLFHKFCFMFKNNRKIFIWCILNFAFAQKSHPLMTPPKTNSSLLSLE